MNSDIWKMIAEEASEAIATVLQCLFHLHGVFNNNETMFIDQTTI